MYYIPLHNKIGSCLDCPCLETLADIPSETSATFNKLKSLNLDVML